MKCTIPSPVSAYICFMVFFNGFACSTDRSEKEWISAAPSVYGILAEKSLDLMAGFDTEAWGAMLSDSVVFYFTDGGEKKSGNFI